MSESANPYLLTLPQLMSAKKKIGRVAAFFDPKKISLSGFDSVCLDATQFREQLRRNLNVIVTDEELGALVFLFDKNGDGFVDSVEFKNEFFRLGKQERSKFNMAQKAEKARIESWQVKNRERQREYLEKFSLTKVATKWTEAEEREAIQKLAHIAFTYDAFKGGLESFDHCIYVNASEFREIMRRKFEVNFTPEETGALLSMFDKAGNGMIDTREFLYQFFKIGRKERDYHFNRQKQLTKKHMQEEVIRRKAIKDRFGEMVKAKITPATEEDHVSAYQKIKMAATYFKGDSVFSSNLWKSFESEELTPTEFKELLKTNFDIYLTPGELDAMVYMFDTDKNGGVSCVEFMTTFFRIALKERSNNILTHRAEVNRRQVEKEQRIRRLAAEQKAKTLTRIVWPVLPDEDMGTMTEDAIAKKKLASTKGEDGRSLAPALPSLEPGRKGGFTSKKISMGSIMSPARSSDNLKKGQSMSALFPKASLDTRVSHESPFLLHSFSFSTRTANLQFPHFSYFYYTQEFIKELEAQEREIRRMKGKGVFTLTKSKKTKKKKKKPKKDTFHYQGDLFDGNDVNEDGIEGNLEDFGWSEQKQMSTNQFVSRDGLGASPVGGRPGTSQGSERGSSRGGSRQGALPHSRSGQRDNSIAEEAADESYTEEAFEKDASVTESLIGDLEQGSHTESVGDEYNDT